VTSSDFTNNLGLKLDPKLEDELFHCVGAAIRNWTFPPPRDGKKVEVTYPFVFKQAAVVEDGR
jgi:hypothetical protein